MQHHLDETDYTCMPPGFLWGTATSSHQVEGNNTNNDWWLWEQEPGHINGQSKSGAACSWWQGKAEEDLALAACLGQNAHRLSLEWSRLEPEEGKYDRTAFARYRQILSKMKELKLTAMVTLYHFTLPIWAAKAGGWANPRLIACFARLAEECARELGDLVPLWATINEPSVLAYMAYGDKKWPPGLGNVMLAFRALRHLLLAHGAAYHAIHKVYANTSVGIVLNMPAFEPARPSLSTDRAVAWLQDWVVSGVILRALRTGKMLPPVSQTFRFEPSLRHSYDFVGVNYYGQLSPRFDIAAWRTAFGRHVQAHSIRTENNDWGAICPRGLLGQLLRLQKLGAPLYVTENGVFDKDDTIRPQYLVSHIAAVRAAITQGVDVRGYFHWSLLDNFEWAQGWSTPFGLIAVNPVTQERQVKESGKIYSAICKANGLAGLR